MKKLLALIVALLLPVSAAASEGLQVLPKWHMKDGEACYSFNEAKLLLELDSEFAFLREITPRYELIHERLSNSVKSLENGLELQRETTQLLLENNKILEQQLRDAIVAKNQAEANKAPGMGWAVAGGLTLVLVGVVVGAYLWPGPQVK